MKFDLKTILSFVFGVLLLIVAIGFGMKRQGDKYVRDVQISIEDQEGNFFLDQPEVIELINADHTDFVLGLTMEQLDLKMLERRVEEHAFVNDAQMYFDITGTLRVNVKQAKPIARILSFDGKGKYIDNEGNLLPLNAKHTARVPIVEFDKQPKWESSIAEDEKGKELIELLHFIHKDEFWRAQIANILIDEKWDITMIPQVTKQEIVFGQPNDLEKKFKKLELFYKEILPAKGWNNYAYVNVKYSNQIVCE